MSKTQAALQRRLGRLSMLIDLVAADYDAESELVESMRKELALIKEISMRLTEVPEQHTPKPSQNSERPAVTSRRP